MKVTQDGTRTIYDKRFLPKQEEAMACAAPELLLSGAFGSGKTRTLAEKALMLSVKYPGNRIGLFRRTAKSCRTTTVRKLLEPDGNLPPVIPPNLIVKHFKKDGIIRLRTDPPSEIMYGGLDQRGKDGEAWFNSMDFGAILVDQAEEIGEDDFLLLSGRLRNPIQPLQQIILAVNPKGKSHWIYKRFFVERSRIRHTIRSTTFDNIFLPKAYVDRLSSFTGSYYNRFVLGEWVDLEGLVYPNFDPLIHVIPRAPIPSSWEMFWSVDFGFKAPFTAQLWVIAEPYPEKWKHARLDVPEGSMIMAKEIYYTKRLVSAHASRMVELVPLNITYDVVCDWDAEDTATIENEGYESINAIKSMDIGIQAMMHRLGNTDNPMTGEYVEPRMFFMHNALDELDETLVTDETTGKNKSAPVCTPDEFGFYSWRKNKDGSTKLDDKPIDEHNHGMDNGRYAVMHVDHGGDRSWIG